MTGPNGGGDLPFSDERTALEADFASALGTYIEQRVSNEGLTAIAAEQEEWLWDDQKEALAAIEEARHDPEHQEVVEFLRPNRLKNPGQTHKVITSTLIRMPTGRGKTELSMCDVDRFYARQPTAGIRTFDELLESKPDARVLFLAHRNGILKQSRGRFEEHFGERYKYGYFNGDEKATDDNVNFLFATFQSMDGHRQAFREDEFDYVIVDEAHHSKAYSYEPTLRYFKPDHRLAMTATPDRMDLLDIRDIFGEEVYIETLAEALAKKRLPRVDYRVILDDIQLDQLTAPDPSFLTIKALNKAMFIPRRDEEIAALIMEHMAEVQNAKNIIFAASIEHAERMAALLPNARAYHSKMKQSDLDEARRLYDDGEIHTLVTVDMFNEGIDIPNANVVTFLRSTGSENVFLQQLGRGLRQAPGKEEVRVLDFVANADRLMLLRNLIYAVSQYDPEASPFTVARAPIKPRRESIAREIQELDDRDIASFDFDETTLFLLDILEKEARREEVKQRYEALAETRRGAFLYVRSLQRTSGKLPTRKMINDAFKRGEGPSLKQLAAPYGGTYEDLIQSLKIDTGNNKALEAAVKESTAEYVRELNSQPLQFLLQDILQRHQDTVTGNLASEAEYGKPLAYSDHLEFKLQDDDTEYGIDIDLYFGWMWLSVTDPVTRLAQFYRAHILKDEPTIWRHLQHVDEKSTRDSGFLNGEEQAALIQHLQAIREQLEREHQLNNQWRDDVALLPEKAPPLEAAA